MRQYENGGILIETLQEFPNVPSNIQKLYLDTETTSGDKKKNSLNPWFNCEILGIAFKFDDSPTYYIPSRHRLPGDVDRNIHPAIVNNFLNQLLYRTKIWINHNIKYDMHVVKNSGKVNLDYYDFEAHDTLTLAKLVDSDMFKYDLGTLSYEVCHENISDYEEKFRPYTHTQGGQVKNKDYGLIPLDYVAPYACQDVITNEKLYVKLLENLESHEVWNTERKLTKILYSIEQKGMRVDYAKAMIDRWIVIPRQLFKLKEEIHIMTGLFLELHKNSDCYELICGVFKLPVLEYSEGSATKEPEPSFGHDALKAYEVYNKTTDTQRYCISVIREYRRLHKLLTGFINPYLDLSVNSGDNKLKLHCFYNQCVRTGRMSCSSPNMQQLSADAKEYIIPEEGKHLITFDLKQIEPRIVMHYIKNPRMTKLYKEDPSTDCYTETQKFCNISRDDSKILYLGSCYGMGRPKIVLKLRESIATEDIPSESLISFEEYCDLRGEEIYKSFHESLPELKRTAWKASNTLRSQGYVRNIAGRIRKMPKQFHFKAFNNVIQSSAADIMKKITVAIYENLEEGEDLLAIVHDDWTIQTDNPEKTRNKITKIVESVETGMEIPIYASSKTSNKHWGECK